MQQYIIQPQSGIKIEVMKNQKISIIDVEGSQVADFFAVGNCETRSQS